MELARGHPFGHRGEQRHRRFPTTRHCAKDVPENGGPPEATVNDQSTPLVDRHGHGGLGLFWSVNLFWIGIDLAIVVWALIDPILEVDEFRRVLAINGGLDLAYLVTGLVLYTRRDRLAGGFGAAILVQGGFLLVFDLGWWWALGASAG